MTMIATQFISHLSLKREQIGSYADYPFNLPVLQGLDGLPLHPQVTFVVGENGSGKSTLLEALAVSQGFNPEGGSRHFHFGTRESHSSLHQFLRVAKGLRRPKTGFFLRAESFFNVATEIERLDAEPSFGPPVIDSYGGVSLHEQSHGESFLNLMLHRFGGQGLYILDEPEAALSPQRQLTVLARLHQLVGEGSQFIIATHSPILMAYPNAWLYVCGPNGLVRTVYRDTEHYQVMHDFMLQPERMLALLLAQD